MGSGSYKRKDRCRSKSIKLQEKWYGDRAKIEREVKKEVMYDKGKLRHEKIYVDHNLTWEKRKDKRR